MKTISIEIDCGNGLCSNCERNDSDVYCQQFDSDILGGERLPACIAAEQLHKDAVTVAGYVSSREKWCEGQANKTPKLTSKITYAANRILKGEL